MTRKKEEATAGLRRGRTLATAGLGAATLIAGLAYAMPANAATPTNPTLTLKMDSQIANDNTTAANLSIEVNNKQTGNADIAYAALKLTLTVPAGIDCSDITITGTPTLTTSSTSGTCVFSSGALGAVGTPAFAANTDTTESYTVKIAGQTAATPISPAKYITGPITGVAELDANTSGGAFSSVLATSNTATSNLVTPGPATLANTAAPVANYGQNYGFQVVTSPGFPATPVNQTTTDVGGGYAAWGILSSRTTPPAVPDVKRGADTAVDVTTGTGATATHDYYISLNDTDLNSGSATGSQTGFFFDTVTGKIVYGTLHVDSADQTKNTFVASAPTGLAAVNFNPEYNWVIVANNGKGTTAVGGNIGSTGLGANLVAVTIGDTGSAASSLDVGFSDVSATSPFINDIDRLAKNGIINGYINGTYGPKQTVNREQFVAFAARMYAVDQHLAPTVYDGSCNPTTNPSQFADVPNNSQFCLAIQTMASAGVVKGYTATTFGPIRLVQRQEIAAFVTRTAELFNGQTVQDLPQTATQFTDVPASNIFSGDINFVASNGITKGATATTFLPHNTALRQEVAAFMDRLATDLSVPLS